MPCEVACSVEVVRLVRIKNGQVLIELLLPDDIEKIPLLSTLLLLKKNPRIAPCRETLNFRSSDSTLKSFLESKGKSTKLKHLFSSLELWKRTYF